MRPSNIILRALKDRNEIETFLSKNTWSVSELFVRDPSLPEPTKPTPQLLSKLLKQAGLQSVAEGSPRQKQLLSELENQLVFVEHISTIDTDGIEPLTRISPPPVYVTLDMMKNIEPVADETREGQNWNPVSLASKKKGNFYVLEEDLKREA